MGEEIFEKKFRFYAEVILPLALSKNYIYGIPAELERSLQIGMRVEVQFGKRKIYAGIVKKILQQAPVDIQIKSIIQLLDDNPIVSAQQLKFWEWIASYYGCTEGEVLTAALPVGFRLESESEIMLNPDFDASKAELSDREFMIAEALQESSNLSVDEIRKIIRVKNVHPVIYSLLQKDVISVKEKLIGQFKPKIQSTIRLNPEFSSDEKLKDIFDELEKKAPKQIEVLQVYIHLNHQAGKNYDQVLKNDLLEKSKGGNAALQTLLKKKILLEEKKEVSRLKMQEEEIASDFSFTPKQQMAYREINESFKKHEVALLHGVTGSGKTHLYIRLIEEQLLNQKQVLYLVPEISLTAQLIRRLRKHFGDQVGIYHSRFNSSERIEIWNKMLNGEYTVMLGARSSLFLPLKNPGLVIVDEEHDSSFKQNDPAPRYHGRDAAIFLAAMLQAKVLLGSATPSVESYFNAKNEKFGFIKLDERYTGVKMPEIIFSNVREARQQKKLHAHFTDLLLEEMKATLQRDEQIILFQNRRGFAPYLECETCGWTAMCPNCDVHLTYHKLQNELRCHYCGHRKKNFERCPACGNSSLKISGFGTEKIEDDLKVFFPEVFIARLDLDAVKANHGAQKIIQDFELKKTQILVGTQMVTKGLDFENVTLVGIINADQLLNQVDFRNTERAFQLMNQVSGRAGRKNHRGKVIIQYSRPHSLFRYVAEHDYEGFYEEEIKHRKEFYYPPFCRLIQITFKQLEAKNAWDAAKFFANEISIQKNIRLLGPSQAPVSRVRNQYLVQLLLKIERSATVLQKVKGTIRDAEEKMQHQPDLRSVQVIVDVDPA